MQKEVTTISPDRTAQLADIVLETIQDHAIYIVDIDGCVRSWNNASRRVFGYSAEKVIGCHFSLFYSSEDRTAELPDRMLGEALLKGRCQYEGWQYMRNGSRFWAHMTLVRMQDETGNTIGCAKITRDLTEKREIADLFRHARKEVEKRVKQRTAELLALNTELDRLATTDPLTGLANRRRFLEICRKEMLRCQRYGRPLSFLFIDLDNFKRINDDHGHAAGDCVLRIVADLLSSRLRPSDTLARIGGDEFVVLLTETDGSGADELADRLGRAIESHPVQTEDATIRVSASIGTAPYVPGSSLEELMMLADRALLTAKACRRNNVTALFS
jgi:diguanylate cyclase (GGDEF)-like protein/PAS domain S-box-containing protein